MRALSRPAGRERPVSPVTAKTRLLLRVELRALIYRMDGEFYADAPQFGVWYNAESIDAASDGLIDGVTALLSTALERGTQHSYLTSRGFRTEGRTYRFPGEDKMLKKYFAHIEWPQEDVDRGHSICLEIELRALEVTNAFPELGPTMVWQQARKPEAAANVC